MSDGVPIRSEIPSERDERWRLLVNAIGAIRDYGIFLLDVDGTVLTWNLGAQNIKGYAESEIVGRNFSVFYPPEEVARAHPQHELEQAGRTGRYEEEGWRVRKDGSRFWASIVITRLSDSAGRTIGFSKVTRDLSERRVADQRLIESEERFRLLVDGVRDYAIFALDPRGVVVSWNEGARRIKGYDEAEVLGRHFSIFYTPEEIQAGKCDFELEEAALTGRFEDEGWRVRKDGSMLWASVVITALRDRNRKLIGFTKITRDLTERRRAEIRLRHAYEELEKKVEDRTRDLSISNASLRDRELELEHAVRVRDEFLSIASHELKTPITTVKMQLQMLRNKTRPGGSGLPEPDRVRASLDVSIRQIDRLTVLIDDLLDVARAQGRKLGFHFESVDLSALLADNIAQLAEPAASARCTVTLEADPHVIGHLDRFRFEQVVVNLLSNAFKYAPGTQVRVILRKHGELARLVVRDGGPGVPLDARERIFGRFERATSSRNIGGLGLGLYIVKEIVEGHRGTVRVEGDAGQGASFVIEVPLNLIPVGPVGPVGAGA
jgi:PAS domain S-box-containing protein